MGREHRILKKFFWKLPLPIRLKVKIRSMFSQNKDLIQYKKNGVDVINYKCNVDSYINQIISLPSQKSCLYEEFERHDVSFKTLLCAFYLTQYHPTEKNNLWWGKGTTEWTNVSKAVPQFVEHYQPRLPGELGFYDLRIVDNMKRQIELAKNYGINAFCFYYYWFNGERALELPLNNFLINKELDIQFCLCWCNENWTKRYSGISSEVLLSIDKSVDSYISFIYDLMEIFKDERYLKIDNKFVLLIYRPSEIPNCKVVLNKWREIVKSKLNSELYLIASQEAMIDEDWTKYGFDAISQFHPASCIGKAVDITKSISPIRTDFKGHIYDYRQMVEKKLFLPSSNKKIYPSVMPMWDNTARRDNSGNIFFNSTPQLYKRSLLDAIEYSRRNVKLDKELIFINAWNEWSEGAYLEPDRYFGYAYLEATYSALKEMEGHNNE